MKKLLFGVALIAMCAPAMADDAVVSFTGKALMPSYRDKSMHDVFTATLTDKQIVTDFKVTCQSAVGGFFGKKQDQACAVTGNGSVINPTNQKRIPRAQYAGGYTVNGDGYTDASPISVNYLAAGNVPASSATFNGSMNLKPEKASTGAQAMADIVLANIQNNAPKDALIDKRVDTVQFSNLVVPSAGLPSDKGCAWNGNMIFTYQTNSWFLDLNAHCGDHDYHLKGNMPWTDSPGATAQTQYDLNLVLPSAANANNDDLFVSGGNGVDVFAQADGLSGQIIMKEAGYVNYVLEGQTLKQSTNTDISGSFTGHNLPVETVRSFSQLVFFLSKTFFGA